MNAPRTPHDRRHAPTETSTDTCTQTRTDTHGHTRRRAAGIALSLAGAAGAVPLAACGAGAGSATGEKAAPSLKPASIAASNWVDHGPAMQAYAQEFPQIKVDYTPMGGTGPHYEKVQAASVAGTPIDAFWLHDAMVTQLTGSGMVRPLDEYLKREKDATEDIFPVALKYHTRGGKQYGIPQNLSIYMVYYDADRFQEVGVPVPRSDWTIEQFLEAAQKIARSGSDRAGVTLQTDRRGYWMFVRAHGGAWLTEDGARSRLAEPDTIAGVQYVKDLLDRHKVAARPRQGAREWVPLQERQAGMLIALNSEAAWNLRKAQLPFKWDLAEPPRGAKGRGAAQAATAWSMAEGGKNLDAAWHFVKWMTGEKAQRLLSSQNALVASRKKVVEDPGVNPPPPANLKATSSAHAYADFYQNPAVVLPTPEKAKQFDDALNAAIADIFADKSSVRDALMQADTLVKQQGVVK